MKLVNEKFRARYCTLKTVERFLCTGGGRGNRSDDSGDGEEQEGDFDHDWLLLLEGGYLRMRCGYRIGGVGGRFFVFLYLEKNVPDLSGFTRWLFFPSRERLCEVTMHAVGINKTAEERKENRTKVTHFPLMVPTIQRKWALRGFEGDITHMSEPRRYQGQLEEHLRSAKCRQGASGKNRKENNIDAPMRIFKGILASALWPLLAHFRSFHWLII